MHERAGTRSSEPVQRGLRMTDPALSQLVAELFIAIKMLSGYPVPDAPPEIHRLPRAELEAMVCRTPAASRPST